jgi:HEAT repeat protein
MTCFGCGSGEVKITPDLDCWVQTRYNQYYLPPHKAQEARDIAKEILLVEPEPKPRGKGPAALCGFCLGGESGEKCDIWVGSLLPGHKIVEVRVGNKASKLLHPDRNLRQRLDAFFSQVTSDIPTILENLENKESKIRLVAVEGLAGRWSRSAEVIPALSRTLKDKDLKVRRAAAVALIQMGRTNKETLEVLLEDMHSRDKDVRKAAVWALGQVSKQVGAAILPALRKALKDEDEEVRGHAAQALGEMGLAAREAVPDLIETLHHKAWTTRLDAASALGEIGPAAKAAVPALIQALDDPEERVQKWAIHALKEIGTDARAAVPALTKRLEDEAFREEVAAALIRIDPKNVKATRVLREIRKKRLIKGEE